MRLRLLPLAIALAACSGSDAADTTSPPLLECPACNEGTLDLGAVALGESAERRIVLQNVGGAVAVVDELASGSLPAGFSTSLGCAGDCSERTVAPGEELAISFTFAPAAVGEVSGRVELGPDGPGLHLAARGIESALRCDARRIDFGNVVRNTTEVRSLDCENLRSEPLELHVGPLSGVDRSAFVVQGLGSRTLEPGASTTIEIAFSPGAAGERSATLPLADGAGRTLASVFVNATGLDSALVPMGERTDAGCIDMGLVGPGSQRTVGVELRNRSADRVRITSLEGLEAPFALASGLPLEIEAGQVAQLQLRFSPEEAGQVGARASLISDDPGKQRLEFCLDGRAGGPRLSCTTDALHFGIGAVGVAREATVECTNEGWEIPGLEESLLVVEGIAASDAAFAGRVSDGGGAAAFRVGESFPIAVRFTPSAPGEVEGQLSIRSNDSSEPFTEIALRGEGRMVEACDFSLASESLDFGRLREAGMLPLRLQNEGDTPCLVGDFALQGADTFSAQLPQGVRELEAGGELSLPVRFEPEGAAGAWEGALSFWINDPAQPVRKVPLRGSAGGCLLVAGQSVRLGPVGPACTAEEAAISVFNACEEALHLQGLHMIGDETFSLVDEPALPIALDKGQHVELLVAHQPGDGGSSHGLLQLEVEEGEERHGVALHGAGQQGFAIETFVAGNVKKDILFVLDDTVGGGLRLWQDPGALLQVAGRHDYRIAMTTNTVTGPSCTGRDGAEAGRIVPVEGGQRIIHPDLPMSEQEAAIVANSKVGSCAMEEKGLQAAELAFSSPLVDSYDDPRTLVEDDGNRGFLRPDADLEIVLWVDDGEESPLPVDYYAAFFAGLKQKPYRVRVHAVGDIWGGVDTDRYRAIVEETGGAALLGSDYPGTIEPFAEAILAPPRCFRLGGTPADVDAGGLVEVEVRVNGTRLGADAFGWDEVENEICLAELPEAGSVVEISYAPSCL